VPEAIALGDVLHLRTGIGDRDELTACPLAADQLRGLLAPRLSRGAAAGPDVDAVVAMLADDARYSMPPLPAWYRGKDEIRAFLLRDPLQRRWRFLPTSANGQVAFGTYLWDDAAAAYIPGGLDVLTLRDGRVAEIAAFLNADLTRFGLPERVDP